MGKTYIVKDTMEAFFDSANKKKYFLGLTTEASIARKMNQELLKAGIGSKVVGVLNEDDGWEVNVTTGIFYEDLVEMQIGTEFTSVTDLSVQEVAEEEDGTITATPKTVSGNALELEAGAFPKNGQLQLHTIAYDPQDNIKVADIYYIFHKAAPDGNFSQTFGMGKNNIQEVKFTPLVPKGKTSYGTYVIVPADQTPVTP